MAEPLILAPTSRPPAARRTRRQLLLVDDDLSVGRFLGHAAEECGYEAAITVTAESFRSQYHATQPDIVVLDLALPGSDGVELLRFLAEEKSRARIILISGFDERVLGSAMRLGAAMGLAMGPPLHKPVRLDRLMAAMLGEEVADDPCLG